MGKKKTFLAGHVNVDAGLIYIGDPGSVVEPSGPPEEIPDWDEFVDRILGEDYKAEGEIPNVAKEPLGQGSGIVIPSGYGDGIYPVYVTLGDDGRPEAAMIVFKSDG
jgi:hypothetical protein